MLSLLLLIILLLFIFNIVIIIILGIIRHNSPLTQVLNLNGKVELKIYISHDLYFSRYYTNLSGLGIIIILELLPMRELTLQMVELH